MCELALSCVSALSKRTANSCLRHVIGLLLPTHCNMNRMRVMRNKVMYRLYDLLQKARKMKKKEMQMMRIQTMLLPNTTRDLLKECVRARAVGARHGA
jgi:hypothetical protein